MNDDQTGSSTTRASQTVSVAVDGGDLHAVRWEGSGAARPVVAIHGITANHLSWEPVAARLSTRTVIAPDLRGRGASSGLPAPFGLDQYARDVARLIEHSGGGPVDVAGHSMGAFVAIHLAAARPDLVERLTLVDGGLPLAPPPPREDGSVPTVEDVLGPALARLAMTFVSPEAYLAFWRAHPAFAEDWTPAIEAYFRYDLGPSAPWRSRVNAEAVRTNTTQLGPGQEYEALMTSLDKPVRFLWAPRGLLAAEPLYDREYALGQLRRIPGAVFLEAPGTNHYTVTLGDHGADLTADAIGDDG